MGDRMEVAADTVRKHLLDRGVTMRDTDGRSNTKSGGHR
jgi:hypothetical protein